MRARVAGVCRRVLEKATAETSGGSHFAACFGAAIGLQAMSMQLVCALMFPLLPSLIRTITPCMIRVRSCSFRRTTVGTHASVAQVAILSVLPDACAL